MMTPVYVKCPQCRHVFDCHKKGELGFWWGADQNGDPTVENMTCPACLASTKPFDKRRKQWSFDDFKDVQK